MNHGFWFYQKKMTNFFYFFWWSVMLKKSTCMQKIYIGVANHHFWFFGHFWTIGITVPGWVCSVGIYLQSPLKYSPVISNVDPASLSRLWGSTYFVLGMSENILRSMYSSRVYLTYEIFTKQHIWPIPWKGLSKSTYSRNTKYFSILKMLFLILKLRHIFYN